MHRYSNDRRRARRRLDDWNTISGDPPRTPLGHPVVSRYDVLSERIREDLRIYGSDAPIAPSVYRLQALYLDFGRAALPEHLAESVLQALDIPRESGECAARDPLLLEAERHSFGALDDEDATRVGERVARLSRRALVTVLFFDAHFANVRLAVEVVGGEQPLERAAVGTCAFVAERRIGRGLGGDLRYHAPLRERHVFCSDHCLPVIGPRPSDDRPCLTPRSGVDCGMLRIFEGFRFFASFPEE